MQPLVTGSRSGFGIRLGAALIDGIVLVVVLVILAQIPSKGLAIVLILIAYFGYTIYFEGSPSGQTPGKKLVGIRVVDANTAQPIGFGRAGLRWLGKLVSGIPCYLGYLWVIWDPQKQGWHDKIATTIVVPVSEHPVAKWPG